MKKSFAFDDYGVLFFTLFLVFSSVWTCFIWQNNRTGEKALCIFVLIIAVCFIAMSPHFFTADEKGLTVYYIFLMKDYYAWEDIRRIEEIWRYRSVYYRFDAKEHTKKAFLWYLNFIKVLC